jgi:DNA helicase HerA-like ATPase
LILVSQSLSEIPEGAVRNTGIKIIHKVESPSDLKFLRTFMREKNIVDKILTLAPGECIMNFPGGVESLQVRPVDELPLSRESVDEVIMMNSFYWISR